MQALAAREGMAKFSVEGEYDGHAFAAPLAALFKILFNLAGDALFFVALALCGGEDFTFAEIDHRNGSLD